MRSERIIWAAAFLFASSSVYAHDETGVDYRGSDKGEESIVGPIVEVSPQFILAGTSSRSSVGGPTKNAGVNKRLKSCLQELKCRVTGTAGVSRDPKPSNRCMVGRSQWSCHLLSEAIDITSATCSKAKLRDCLAGVGYRACYDGKGGCKSKTKILHFGNHEIFCAPRIYMKWGRCKNR